eukprot:660776-Hanusia_phi.AAC.2
MLRRCLVMLGSMHDRLEEAVFMYKKALARSVGLRDGGAKLPPEGKRAREDRTGQVRSGQDRRRRILDRGLIHSSDKTSEVDETKRSRLGRRRANVAMKDQQEKEEEGRVKRVCGVGGVYQRQEEQEEEDEEDEDLYTVLGRLVRAEKRFFYSMWMRMEEEKMFLGCSSRLCTWSTFPDNVRCLLAGSCFCSLQRRTTELQLLLLRSSSLLLARQHASLSSIAGECEGGGGGRAGAGAGAGRGGWIEGCVLEAAARIESRLRTLATKTRRMRSAGRPGDKKESWREDKQEDDGEEGRGGGVREGDGGHEVAEENDRSEDDFRSLFLIDFDSLRSELLSSLACLDAVHRALAPAPHADDREKQERSRREEEVILQAEEQEVDEVGGAEVATGTGVAFVSCSSSGEEESDDEEALPVEMARGPLTSQVMRELLDTMKTKSLIPRRSAEVPGDLDAPLPDGHGAETTRHVSSSGDRTGRGGSAAARGRAGRRSQSSRLPPGA